MRQNLPVTNEEYIIPNGIHLVSKTDLKGTIIECNDAFEMASGYSRAELIGQPHNMIRHPDVPPVVFKDLWNTIQQGLSWTQFVKNRRKDGGFYWVKANTTPLFKDGKITGYMSVRTNITDAEKALASKAYKDIANGKLNISFGQLHQGPDWRKFNFIDRLPLFIVLPVMAFLLAVLPAIMQAEFNSPSSITLGMELLFFVLLTLFAIRAEKQASKTANNLLLLASKQSLDIQKTNPYTKQGKVSSSMMSASLAFMAENEEAEYQLDKSRQLQLLLDKATTNIMMADKDYNITYMNEQLKEFLSEREARLKKSLPQFDMKTVIGSNIDIFHKNPSHNRAVLQAMTGPIKANIELADYHFELSLIPIKNRTGIQVGIMVEWTDKTQEVILKNTITGAVDNAKLGYLEDRIDLSQLDGVAYDLSKSLNDLMESISSALHEVTEITTSLANGNLTEIITTDYQGDLKLLKDSVNASISRLDGIVAISVEAAQVVDSTAAEVSQSADHLSDRVQNQAAALEQTSATMHEMNATIQTNSENAQAAQKLAQQAKRSSDEGQEIMSKNVEAMSGISESSEKIADIVSLIDGIAFQTNLLALNAAVEAARAGEHGRGFAVVAGEVRSLAQKSADAAREIKSLIEESVSRINFGVELTEKSGLSLKNIGNDVHEITMMIEQIAAASKEQAQGISQVHEAIDNIDQVTQQNAALVEETTAAAESLKTQANNLTKNMSYFKTTHQVNNSSLKSVGTDYETPKPNKPSDKVAAKPKTETSQIKKVEQPIASPVKNDDEWSDF